MIVRSIFIVLSLFLGIGQVCHAMKRPYEQFILDQGQLNQSEIIDIEEDLSIPEKSFAGVEAEQLLNLPNTPSLFIPLTPDTPQAAVNETHLKETPFTCPQCSQAFGTKDTLKAHLLTCSGESLQCPQCKKQYAPKRYQQHIKQCPQHSLQQKPISISTANLNNQQENVGYIPRAPKPTYKLAFNQAEYLQAFYQSTKAASINVLEKKQDQQKDQSKDDGQAVSTLKHALESNENSSEEIRESKKQRLDKLNMQSPFDQLDQNQLRQSEIIDVEEYLSIPEKSFRGVEAEQLLNLPDTPSLFIPLTPNTPQASYPSTEIVSINVLEKEQGLERDKKHTLESNEDLSEEIRESKKQRFEELNMQSPFDQLDQNQLRQSEIIDVEEDLSIPEKSFVGVEAGELLEFPNTPLIPMPSIPNTPQAAINVEAEQLLDLPNTPSLFIPLTPDTPQAAVNIKSFKCAFCSLSFLDKIARNNHHKAQHQDEDGFYHCPYSKCKFKTQGLKGLIYKHYNPVHLKQKLFTCSHCSKSFYREYDLKTHLPICLGVSESFKCALCSLSFPNKSTKIKHHIAQHQDEDGFYHCPYPECKFKTKKGQGLDRLISQHYNPVHLKEIPFTCPQCSQPFGTKGSLDAHLKTCSGQSLQCPHCKNQYGLRYYKQHINKCSQHSLQQNPISISTADLNNQQENVDLPEEIRASKK